MDKIYLVTEGEYSDYGVSCVVKTKELAERLKALSHGDEIEEYALIESESDIASVGRWRVWMDCTHTILHGGVQYDEFPLWQINQCGPFYNSSSFQYNNGRMVLCATSLNGEQHAIKTAYDIVAQFKCDFPEYATVPCDPPHKIVVGRAEYQDRPNSYYNLTDWERIRSWEQQVIHHRDAGTS